MILLYIDPGTGSMLFTILIGLFSVLVFAFQKLRIKIKGVFRGRGGQKADAGYLPYVIFSDDKRYWEYFRPICDLFEEKKTSLSYLTCSQDDPALQADYKYINAEYIGNINKAVLRLNNMRAGICLATTPGLDVYQWKRSKNTKWYVHLFHGIGDSRAYRMFGMDAFDAVLLTGEHQIEQIRDLENKRGINKKELVVCGDPHVDQLKQRLEQTGKASPTDEITVLVAPSWGNSGLLTKYGERIIDALVSTGYNIVIRPHPQSMTSERKMIDGLMEKYPSGENRLSWNFDNDNFEALNKADIMISDFSSVIWDYAFVFDKPVIYADVSFDVAPYDLAWADDTRWDLRVLAEVGIKLEENDLERIGDIITDAVKSDSLKEKRRQIRSVAWGNPGRSAEAIVEYLTGKYKELESIDPMV